MEASSSSSSSLEFRQIILKLPQASDHELLESAKRMQSILEQGTEKISDLECRQGALHLWNGAVRAKQNKEPSQGNCEGEKDWQN